MFANYPGKRFVKVYVVITAALTTCPEFPQTPCAGGFAVNRFAGRIQNGQHH
jgi:hypothetical protein